MVHRSPNRSNVHVIHMGSTSTNVAPSLWYASKKSWSAASSRVCILPSSLSCRLASPHAKVRGFTSLLNVSCIATRLLPNTTNVSRTGGLSGPSGNCRIFLRNHQNSQSHQ